MSVPPCFCGNPLAYSQCCELIHSGTQTAESAEALMRSRYSAFCLNKFTYLVETHRPTAGISPPRVEDFELGVHWVGLRVIQTEYGEIGDRNGYVDFAAFYQTANRSGQPALEQIRERSYFEFADNRWFYVSGEAASKLKLTRNEACPCNSGKKIKKCHSVWLS
jgi:SEC-C motif-containing protein